jgi:hypothetical protein
LSCGRGYYCPGGNANATAHVCYSSRPPVAAWGRRPSASTQSHMLTMVAQSSLPLPAVSGPMVWTVSSGWTVEDPGDCSPSVSRLPSSVLSSSLLAVQLADMNADAVDDAVVCEGSTNVPARRALEGEVRRNASAFPQYFSVTICTGTAPRCGRRSTSCTALASARPPICCASIIRTDFYRFIVLPPPCPVPHSRSFRRRCKQNPM